MSIILQFLIVKIAAGEVCPEYSITRADGSLAYRRVDYDLFTELKPNGVFMISIKPLSPIIVRESFSGETILHEFKDGAWHATESAIVEKLDAESKKKPIKIEFAEEPPTIADRDAMQMIVRWCFSERTALSSLKEPDGTLKITAINQAIGPQLKAKLESYLLYHNINVEIKETGIVNSSYIITIGQKDEARDPRTESESNGVLGKIHDKFLHDPEVKMLCDKFGIRSTYSSITDRVLVTAPSRHVKELMLIVEGITDDSVVALVDKKQFHCSIVEAKNATRFHDLESVPIDHVHAESHETRE